MQGKRREPRRPGPAVPEPEAAGPAGMAEDRPPRDDVLDEHLARLHAGFVLRLLGAGLFLLQIGVDELPPVDSQFLHVFLDLRRLQAHAVRDHKAGASADPVRLDARQVPEAADLRLLRALAVDRDRAVRDDERDFLVGRGVLQMLDLAVERDLLLESLDFLPGGLIRADPEFPANDVRNQDAQGLTRPSGGPNRARVGQVDVRRAVPVSFDFHARESLERRDEDSFRQDREAHPDRPFDRFLLVRGGPQRHLLRDQDRELLPVVGLRELADPARHAFDLVMFQEALDAGGEVVREGNFHVQFGIEPSAACGARDRIGRLDLIQQAREVGADLLRCDG